MNEFFQLLKYKGMSLNQEESLATSSTNSYKSTRVISFEITVSVVERSSEDSTSNEETSSREIFDGIKENKTSTNSQESASGRTFKGSSSNKEDEVCLKVSHEEDDPEVTMLSYKKLFKLSAKLIQENDNIKNHKLDLKDYIEFLEKSNDMIKHKIFNIKNLVVTCETCVSMK